MRMPWNGSRNSMMVSFLTRPSKGSHEYVECSFGCSARSSLFVRILLVIIIYLLSFDHKYSKL